VAPLNTERFVDFRQVTADALDFALETLGITNPSLRERLIDLYTELDVFPEVPAVLRCLKAAGFKTAVLSNGTQSMLESTLKHNDIGDLVDAVLSVDALGIYKPSSRVYALAPERLGLQAREVAFQSPNAWDAAGDPVLIQSVRSICLFVFRSQNTLIFLNALYCVTALRCAGMAAALYRHPVVPPVRSPPK
jgi:2-haloalkanoic acid dehalogenase type II